LLSLNLNKILLQTMVPKKVKMSSNC